MSYKILDPKTWEQNKTAVRCACTDPDKAECVNFEAEDGAPLADGNETCGCRCHKAVQS